jgi:hypothetical protein
MTLAAQAPGPTPDSFAGTWQVDGQPEGPWLVNLRANENGLTGRIWQGGGLGGTTELLNTGVSGNTVSFTYIRLNPLPRAAVFFPNLVSNIPRLNPPNTFTWSGTLRNDEIAFNSRVDIRNPAGQGIDSTGRGPFGMNMAKQFTAKRAVPAVEGTVVVDKGFARPVFEVRFEDAKGAWFDPLRRGNTWAPSPRPFGITAAATPRPGSALESVTRFETQHLPGNPSEFLVRLPPGEYRPIITGLPSGYAVKSVQVGSVNLGTDRFKVTDKAPVALTIALSVTPGADWGKVSGLVENQSTRTGGDIPANSRNLNPPTAIVLANEKYSEFWMATVGAGGTFEFPSLPPGTYELRAFPDTPLTPSVTLVLPPGANVRGLRVTAANVLPMSCPGC